MTRYATVRTDRWAPKACPVIEYHYTQFFAEAYAREECKWESTDRVFVLDPSGSVVATYEGDFNWLDDERE